MQRTERCMGHLVSVARAVWHYPLTLRGFNYPDHPLTGSLLVFPVSCIFMSIVFGWLRLQSGSVWCSSLAHSATNAIGGGLFILLFGAGGNSLVVSPAGLLGWIPLGALSAWIVLTGRLKPATDVLESAHRGEECLPSASQAKSASH